MSFEMYEIGLISTETKNLSQFNLVPNGKKACTHDLSYIFM